MTRDDLLEWRKKLTEEVAARRQRGDYNADSSGIRMALEYCLASVDHLLEKVKK